MQFHITYFSNGLPLVKTPCDRRLRDVIRIANEGMARHRADSVRVEDSNRRIVWEALRRH